MLNRLKFAGFFRIYEQKLIILFDLGDWVVVPIFKSDIIKGDVETYDQNNPTVYSHSFIVWL